MVCPGEVRHPPAPSGDETVAIPCSPNKRISQSRLHSFSFPSRSWVNHRLLRCIKVSGDNKIGESHADSERGPKRFRTSPGESSRPQMRDLKGGGGGEEEDDEDDKVFREVRKKLMVHYNVAVDKIQKAAKNEEKEEGAPTVAAAEKVSRPWNLRTRRAACNAPLENGRRQNISPAAAEKSPASTLSRFRSEMAERKVSLQLSREEIEEDLVLMFRGKPPRKPKKRPAKVQRQVDMICPGMWLSEITLDTYKVPEEKKKR